MSSWNKGIIRRKIPNTPNIDVQVNNIVAPVNNIVAPVNNIVAPVNNIVDKFIDINTDNICLMILNCKKYDYKRHQQTRKWLNRLNLKYWFHIQGNPNMVLNFEINEQNHIIYVKTEDDYASLPKKVFIAIQAIYSTFPNITHILKTDDDMNINFDKFYGHIPKIIENDYGGSMANVKEDYLSDYHIQFHSFEISKDAKLEVAKACQCTNGRFYFLSRKCMKHILQRKNIFWNAYFEDNTVGFALNDLVDKKILNIPDFEIFSEHI